MDAETFGSVADQYRSNKTRVAKNIAETKSKSSLPRRNKPKYVRQDQQQKKQRPSEQKHQQKTQANLPSKRYVVEKSGAQKQHNRSQRLVWQPRQ